jgi:hypothetical protein
VDLMHLLATFSDHFGCHRLLQLLLTFTSTILVNGVTPVLKLSSTEYHMGKIVSASCFCLCRYVTASNSLRVGRPHSEYLHSPYYRSLGREQDKELAAKREKIKELDKLKKLEPMPYDAVRSLHREILTHKTKIDKLGDEAGQWIFERKCLAFGSFDRCPLLTFVLVD